MKNVMYRDTSLNVVCVGIKVASTVCCVNLRLVSNRRDGIVIMSDEKAEQLMKEAEKQANKFAPFTSSEEKYEKAREKYLQAATMYKASSNFAGAA